MIRITAVFVVLLLLLSMGTATAGPAFKVELLDVFVGKWQGGAFVPYQPMVGEPYQLTARYRIEGTESPPFKLRFQMADITDVKDAGALSIGTHTQVVTFKLPLDDKIDFTVVLNPLSMGSGLNHPGAPTQTKSGNFHPREPAKAVEYYEPKRVFGTQRVEIVPESGMVLRVVAAMGCPDTDSWQRVQSASATITGPGISQTIPSRIVKNPGRHPAYAVEVAPKQAGTIVMEQKFDLILRNQRVSPTRLREATWAQVDALKGLPILAWYTDPEPVVQSMHPVVRAFVVDAIGSDYRQKMTPYDAARTLFKAVMAHLTYTYPKDGAPDLRGHSAVETIELARGDCGSFALMFVGLLRNIGIPARVVCGAWVGKDKGHAWSEMFLPGGGWILSDAMAADKRCNDGSYAYYFGYMPNLNTRMATMRGNTFNLSSPAFRVHWLQGPYVDVIGMPGLTFDKSSSMVIQEPKQVSLPGTLGLPPISAAATDLRCEIRRNGQRYERTAAPRRPVPARPVPVRPAQPPPVRR